MRFEHLDLNLLTALDALLETRSVSQAAKRLHLSQPGVTAALRRLREFFEDDLLVQSGRQMVLTPRAEELVPRVRRVLIQIRADILTPSRFDPAVAKRTLSLVASDYAYSTVLAAVIADISTIAPGISFEIHQPATAAIEALERAEIDLMFTVSAFRVASHPSLTLFRDEYVVIACREAGFTHIDRDTFVRSGHVIARFGRDRQPTLSDSALSLDAPERRIEVVVPTFSALVQAVVGTRRLATMHRLYAEQFAAIYPITIFPSPVKLPEVREIVQWHHLRGADPGVRWLLDRVVRHCAALPPYTRVAEQDPDTRLAALAARGMSELPSPIDPTN
jgi:LysR family transcriptional regulator, nod-box dependent transcriptional activator